MGLSIAVFTNISYTNTPNDQMSTFESYFLCESISGAKYYLVPQKVPHFFLFYTQHPKSPILTIPFFINTFSNLISQ